MNPFGPPGFPPRRGMGRGGMGPGGMGAGMGGGMGGVGGGMGGMEGGMMGGRGGGGMERMSFIGAFRRSGLDNGTPIALRNWMRIMEDAQRTGLVQRAGPNTFSFGPEFWQEIGGGGGGGFDGGFGGADF
ncbi:hypothetical protein L207DRAFT_533037 [Hyaloscypha variabilis F]|uniref:Uncharacterized protein n=1 Tax=Hyaloscypha variabilis (strain UAMH 11265 / GT02V1 / F) TaxID=1149755 RepID=A0A2J6RCA9_HYAVF|nr:hypothetical protein L207DRAFT_533037 [Hyaloscypha variabilis F]